MVAEIIAGITLCNSAYKAIKECIGNVKDVSQIAGHLDNLIDGKRQIDEAVKPTNRIASKWGRMMGAKGIDSEGSMSLGSIAQEKINQKLAEEELEQVKTMIRKRFGYGIWDEIMMEREERLEKHKTAKQKAKEENQKKMDKYYEIAKNVLITTLVIIGMVITFMFYTKQWTL